MKKILYLIKILIAYCIIQVSFNSNRIFTELKAETKEKKLTSPVPIETPTPLSPTELKNSGEQNIKNEAPPSPSNNVQTDMKQTNSFNFPKHYPYVTLGEQILKMGVKNHLILPIIEGKIIGDVNVSTSNADIKISQGQLKKQKLSFALSGTHTKSCSRSFKILSQYENYKKYLSYIKQSMYNELNRELYFHIESDLFPQKFIVNFKLPRIRGVGQYPFIWPVGIFPGLIGNINVFDHNEQCLIIITANWEGEHTGFNDLLLEIFIETISKIGMDKLLRIPIL